MITKSRQARSFAAAVLALALLASACGGGSETSDATSAETAASGLPELVGDTVAGAQLDTNDLAGQDVVVWFWAPW